MIYHLNILEKELNRRKKRNPRYSLRAFALHLGIHSSALSRVLKNKQHLSSKAALEITIRLKMSQEERRMFMKSIVYTSKTAEQRKIGAAIDLPELRTPRTQIGEEVAPHLSSPFSIALMEMTLTHDFKNDLDWIARRLQITPEKTQILLSTLVEVGLLASQNGLLVKTNLKTATAGTALTKEILLRHNKEAFAAALKSLETGAPEIQSHFSAMVAVDPKRIGEANIRILDFLQDLSDFLEADKATEVYLLATQLFPMTVPVPTVPTNMQ